MALSSNCRRSSSSAHLQPPVAHAARVVYGRSDARGAPVGDLGWASEAANSFMSATMMMMMTFLLAAVMNNGASAGRQPTQTTATLVASHLWIRPASSDCSLISGGAFVLGRRRRAVAWSLSWAATCRLLVWFCSPQAGLLSSLWCIRRALRQWLSLRGAIHHRRPVPSRPVLLQSRRKLSAPISLHNPSGSREDSAGPIRPHLTHTRCKKSRKSSVLPAT